MTRNFTGAPLDREVLDDVLAVRNMVQSREDVVAAAENLLPVAVDQVGGGVLGVPAAVHRRLPTEVVSIQLLLHVLPGRVAAGRAAGGHPPRP